MCLWGSFCWYRFFFWLFGGWLLVWYCSLDDCYRLRSESMGSLLQFLLTRWSSKRSWTESHRNPPPCQLEVSNLRHNMLEGHNPPTTFFRFSRCLWASQLLLRSFQGWKPYVKHVPVLTALRMRDGHPSTLPVAMVMHLEEQLRFPWLLNSCEWKFLRNFLCIFYCLHNFQIKKS